MNQQGQLLASMITSSAKGYAAGVVDRQLQVQPDVFERYGERGYADLAGDTEIRLLELSEALAAGTPELLTQQVSWLVVALTARGVDIECLRVNLRCIAEELQANLPAGTADLAVDYLQQASAALDTAPTELPSRLAVDAPHIDLARRYLLAVLETRRDDAIGMVMEAFAAGTSVADIHRHVISATQAEIGRMWQMAEIHVGEEHYATAVASQAMAQLRPAMPRGASNGRRVLCTALGGDLHDLGLQMVSDAFERAGWQSILLGASTPSVDLLHSLRDFEADLLAVSTMVGSEMRATASLIETVRQHGHARIPILVGGMPFSAIPDLWRAVGADGSAHDAEHAVEVATRLVS